MVARIEVLGEENQELRDQISEIEEEKENIHEDFEEFKQMSCQKNKRLKQTEVRGEWVFDLTVNW